MLRKGIGKKGISSSAATMLIIIILGIVAVQYTGIYDFSTLTRVEVEEDDVREVVFCDPTAGITVKLDSKDPWGAVTIDGNNKYKIKDGTDSALSSVADAGTFSAPANGILDIWFQLDSNDHYTKEVLGKDIACTSPLVITQDVMPEGNLTFTFKNEDGTASIKEGASYETLGVGDIVDLDFTVKGEYQRHQPYKTVVVEWNKTAIDEVTMFIGGAKLGPATIPLSHTDKLPGGQQVAYAFPVIEQNAKVEGFAMVDADDTVQPAAVADANLYSCIHFTYFDMDCVEVDESPYVECGVTEDPDDDTTDVGDANEYTFFCYS